MAALAVAFPERGLSAREAPDPPSASAGWQDGFFVESAEGDFRLGIGMVAQADGRFVLNTPPPVVSTFAIRKLRPTLTGRLGRAFEFKVMPDFGNGTTVVQDAYLDIRFAPWLRVRSGKDKTPVGYELLQGDAFLLFPERALASSLVPNRDIGIQVQGDVVGGAVSYAAGIFNGIPDGTSASGDVDSNGGKDVAGRVIVHPFHTGSSQAGTLDGLGVHVGGSAGREVGALPTFKTSVGQAYFAYAADASASGPRQRISPAVSWYHGPFGAFIEYMRSAQRIARRGVEADVVNSAWEATGSYVLTGEPAGERGIHPARVFDPGRRQWGAVQVLGRYSVLRVDPVALSSALSGSGVSGRASSLTLAVNWYPSAFVKYYATYERTAFDGGTAARPTEHAVIVRTQLAF